MVYYRKYRPQKIEELDSLSVRESLIGLFGKSIENVPHALLFTGSKGLGKTSTARIVAKVVNCTGRKDKKSIEPCDKCDQCISITKGSNLDVMEIDGASNRGIDEIRDLREKIKLAPVSSNKKVYTIDEVHMLTTDAFNALLKTLEEPPAHALFILCTTEAHKLPSTIVSRCFQVQFKKATNVEIVNSLERIVKGEKLNVEKEALEYIATFSDGAFRDGAKILEEVVLQAGDKKITKEFVEQKYKTNNLTSLISEMLDSLKEKNPKEGFALVAKLAESGADIRYFVEQLISELHDDLLANVGGKEGRFNIEQIKQLIELLNKAHMETKFAVISQLPLEIAIVEWCYVEVESSKTKIESLPEIKKEDQKVEQKVQSPSSNDFWNRFIDTVKKHNNLTAGVLRSCSLGENSNGKLEITTKFQFHKEKLESQIPLLQQAAQEISGNPTKVVVELKV